VTTVHARYRSSNPDERAIRLTFRDQDGPVGKIVDVKSAAVLAAARALVPVRSGRLLLTLRREVGHDAHGPYADVLAGKRGLTDYLGYVLAGTPPHLIRPRRRKALRFLGRGGLVFARQVNHPGTRANPFLTKALNAAR
jgi:hypothetical protein